MKLDGGIVDQKSYMGSFLTVVITLVTLVFFYTKVQVLKDKSDVDIMSALLENDISYEEKFTYQDGFFVAAALTEYDSNTTMLEEPRYGELIIEHYGWGYNDTIGSQSRNISYHFCSDEELGLARNESTVIYPIRESSMWEVTTYR